MATQQSLQHEYSKAASTRKRRRIFWLGMHQVLTQTELPRLRNLGYEVFHPPYLSPLIDQSAVCDWVPPTDSTLPPSVLEKLGVTDFFYKAISKEISEILNHYFDMVLITINPGWLHHFLRAYQGPVIYRVYGQPYSLSAELIKNETVKLISEREQFWFVPHSDKVLSVEEPWLKTNLKVIPYCLTDDVIAAQDSWVYGGGDSPEMGMLCPRALDIPYYSNNYMHLKHFFPRRNYKIFGAQVVPVDDPQVIGTLKRGDFISRMKSLRGYVYHYEEPTVCYLPPLEYMMLGGPVVFHGGSLLARYFTENNSAPGFAKDIYELQRKAAQIESGDRSLVDEIISSQAPVRRLYHPEYVWPIFDREMRAMIDGGEKAAASLFMLSSLNEAGSAEGSAKAKTNSEHGEVLIPFHAFGPHVHKKGEDYHCAEGIGRVVKMAVRVLTSRAYNVIVTAKKEDVGRVHGFFKTVETSPGTVRVLAVSGGWGMKGDAEQIQARIFRFLKLDKVRAAFRKLSQKMSWFLRQPLGSLLSIRKLFFTALMLPFAVVFIAARKVKRALWNALVPIFGAAKSELNDYVSDVIKRDSLEAVFVPHYYLFPETAEIQKIPLVLYLPDYLPHFYQGQREMGSTEEYLSIGKRICDRADFVVTNSRFTQKYLPETELGLSKDKITYFPLPDLGDYGQVAAGNVPLGLELPELYVFYPTRDRPSKRLAEFVATVAEVNKRFRSEGREAKLFGILTTTLSEQIFELCPDAREYIVSMPELSDAELKVVFRKSVALLFTSELEGNFPTQINEALNHEVPVIATRIPLITEELGDFAKHLKLVEVGDVNGFSNAVMSVLNSRAEAVEFQLPALRHVQEVFSYDRFCAGLASVFQKAAPLRVKEYYVEGQHGEFRKTS